MIKLRVNLEYGAHNARIHRSVEMSPDKNSKQRVVPDRPNTAYTMNSSKGFAKTTRLFSKSYDMHEKEGMTDEDPELEVAKLDEFSPNFNAPPIKEFIPPLKQLTSARLMLRNRKYSENPLKDSKQRQEGTGKSSRVGKTGENSKVDSKLSPYFDLFA